MVEINKTKPEQTAGGPELNRNNVQDAKQVLDNKLKVQCMMQRIR